MNFYLIFGGALFLCFAIALTAKPNWRVYFKDWYISLLFIAGGIMAFFGIRKTKKAIELQAPTEPLSPPSAANENDNYEEINAKITKAMRPVDRDYDAVAERLRIRAERIKNGK